MAQRLSDRWLIALVIIALGAIFVPILLSYYRIFQPGMNVSGWMPQPIFVKSIPNSYLQTELETQNFFQVTNFSTPQKLQVTLAPSAANRYVAKPRAWVIQVASFSTSQNADALQQRLQLHGFPAYVVTVIKPGVTVYRVLIGPFFTKIEAQQEIPKLGKLINLKVIVVPFSADL